MSWIGSFSETDRRRTASISVMGLVALMVDRWRWIPEVVCRDGHLHKTKDTVCPEESSMPPTLDKVVWIFPVVSKLHILRSYA